VLSCSFGKEVAVSELQLLLVFVWLTPIVAPPAALLAIGILRWKAPAKVKPLAVAAGLLVCVPVLLFLAGLRFTQPLATVLSVALAYWAYCMLASIWLRRRLTLVRGVVAVVLITPVIALALYAFSAIGMPLTAMILGDIMAKPARVQYMDNGLACKISPWGNMGVAGYNTALFQTWLLPFLERKVAEIDVTEQRPASCTEVLSKYSGP
jgi:hypothetical protein